VKRDQRIFFPSLGVPNDEGTWQIDVHAWCFRSRARGLVIPLVRKALGLEHAALTPSQEQTFTERARWMFVDNKRGRSISVTMEGRVHRLGKTRPNGHLSGRIAVNLPADRVPACLVTPASLEIHFLTAEGLSVISDIDDTIRVSHVADRAALLRTTFVEPFEAVQGMADIYAAWARNGAQFHYVSATPWQLYVPIAAFLDAHNFPKGTFHLKDFRWHDRTFFNLFASADRYKSRQIEPLLKRLPKRHFVMVGDSGQRDPEVFGDLARRYRQQVRWIFVRDISGARGSALPRSQRARYRDAFAGVDRRIWRVFTDAGMLPTTLTEERTP